MIGLKIAEVLEVRKRGRRRPLEKVLNRQTLMRHYRQFSQLPPGSLGIIGCGQDVFRARSLPIKVIGICDSPEPLQSPKWQARREHRQPRICRGHSAWRRTLTYKSWHQRNRITGTVRPNICKAFESALVIRLTGKAIKDLPRPGPGPPHKAKWVHRSGSANELHKVPVFREAQSVPGQWALKDIVLQKEACAKANYGGATLPKVLKNQHVTGWVFERRSQARIPPVR